MIPSNYMKIQMNLGRGVDGDEEGRQRGLDEVEEARGRRAWTTTRCAAARGQLGCWARWRRGRGAGAEGGARTTSRSRGGGGRRRVGEAAGDEVPGREEPGRRGRARTRTTEREVGEAAGAAARTS